MSKHPKIAFLFLQLGTPSHSSLRSVWHFLYRFLNDWRVIDIPNPFRWILVTLFIIPLRAWRVTQAYKSIWTISGSPLRTYSESMVAKAQLALPHTPIALAMNYDLNGVSKAFEELQKSKCNSIVIIPLFPQYAASSTGTAIANVYQAVAQMWDPPALWVKKDFYEDPGFINAIADLLIRELRDFTPDLIVLSFHGLPVRHIQKSGCAYAESCKLRACQSTEFIGTCYRAQCYQSAKKIHEALEQQGFAYKYDVVFQSRLGSIPWINPDLTQQAQIWKNAGYKNILISTPSFMADCLETLEEIQDRFNEQWTSEVPGGSIRLTPCINDSDIWVKSLTSWMKKIQDIDTSIK